MEVLITLFQVFNIVSGLSWELIGFSVHCFSFGFAAHFGYQSICFIESSYIYEFEYGVMLVFLFSWLCLCFKTLVLLSFRCQNWSCLANNSYFLGSIFLFPSLKFFKNWQTLELIFLNFKPSSSMLGQPI